jgi:ABC-type dipeptide/oligopeptide/nickel transport system ATPase component
MAGDLVLETRGLVKEFKRFVAVDGVDLRVRRGEIHALIGPNGAGKTTCFNLLTKFLTPTRGQIVFEGHDITGEKPAQPARRVEHRRVGQPEAGVAGAHGGRGAGPGAQASIAEALLARSRSWNFWILPVLVLGIGSKRISRGTL